MLFCKPQHRAIDGEAESRDQSPTSRASGQNGVEPGPERNERPHPPLIVMDPAPSLINPLSIFNSVVLPAPLCPISPRHSSRRNSKLTSLTAKNSPSRSEASGVTGAWWRVAGPEADLVTRDSLPATLPSSLATSNSLPATSASSPATRNSLPATSANRRRKGFSSSPMSQTPYQSDFFSDRQNFFETPSTRTRTSSSEGGVECLISRGEGNWEDIRGGEWRGTRAG